MTTFRGSWEIDWERLVETTSGNSDPDPRLKYNGEKDFIYTNVSQSWKSFLIRHIGNEDAHAITDAITRNLKSQEVDDCSALREADGSRCEPYLRCIRTGMSEEPDADGLLRTGDILVYLGQTASDSPLKQRGWHAELCLNEQGVRQLSLWACDNLKDRTVNDLEKQYTAHVIRPFHPALSHNAWCELVAGIDPWTKVWPDKIPFPKGATWMLDPIEFSDMTELRAFAYDILSEQPARDFKMTCVQWNITVLSLALIFPLSRQTIIDLDLSQERADYWTDKLSLPENSPEGLRELPIFPDSPARIVQYYLDTYHDGVPLKDFWSQNSAAIVPALSTAMKNLSLPNADELLRRYFLQVFETSDIDHPFIKPDGSKLYLITPSSFLSKARGSCCPKDMLKFHYIGTLIHQDLLRLKT